jgi:hypothetical protein
MEARRFVILYQRQRNMTLEREVIGGPLDALATAWSMLQDGSAKVAAIVEPGNLEFHVWHHRIVRWGKDHGSHAASPPSRPVPHRTAA